VFPPIFKGELQKYRNTFLKNIKIMFFSANFEYNFQYGIAKDIIIFLISQILRYSFLGYRKSSSLGRKKNVKLRLKADRNISWAGKAVDEEKKNYCLPICGSLSLPLSF